MDAKHLDERIGSRSDTDPRAPIVVGIDGSTTALHAAEWAAAEAVSRRVPLRLVQILPAIDKPAFRPGGTRYRSALGTLNNARWMVRAQQSQVPDAEPLQVDVVLARGQADRLLVEMSASASLLVLGSAAIGFFSHMVLGSTALAVTREARCPVALVRRSAVPDGPVLVVVTTSDTAEPALLAGLRAARDRGVDLVVARIWHGRVWSNGHARPWADATAGHAGGAALVPDAQLQRHQRDFPTVTVRPITVVGDGPAEIERFSAAAQLVIVGHDADALRPDRLGRVTHELVCHSSCPVVVMPGPVSSPALPATAAKALPR
ncbi:universal stress protein [Nocardia sp. IFM 10818]